MDLQKNMKLFTANITDNYNSWAKPWLENIDEFSKKKIHDLLTNEELIKQANDSYNKILNLYDEIKNSYKEQKIKSRKVINVFIIVFSCLFVGLFFLGFWYKNKRVIKEQINFEKEHLKSIENQNEIKKNAFFKLFGPIKKRDVLNSCLENTGLYALNNVFGTQLEKYFKSINKDCIGLHSYGVFKAGKQNIFICNTCSEYWKTISTSAETTVTYVDYELNAQGHLVKKTETLTAQHEEKIPFREIQSFTIIEFQKGFMNVDVDWIMYPNRLETKKDQKDFHDIKFKKIASNDQELINNTTTFENSDFNDIYSVEIFEANGSINQEQALKLWFTLGTQEKFVEMCADLYNKNNFDLIDLLLYKIDDSLIIKNKQIIDCSWYMDVSVTSEIDTSPTASLEDNINKLANIGKKIATDNLIATCEFLNFTKVDSLLSLNPIDYNYSLLNCADKNNDDKTIDSEAIINYGNYVGAFKSRDLGMLIDNIKTVFVYKKEEVTIGIYELDNYSTEMLNDNVELFSRSANQNFYVNVPYTKYVKNTTQSIGIAFKKTATFNVNVMIQKVRQEFGRTMFSIYNESDYLYLFANNTKINKKNINRLKLKVLSLLL